MANVRGRQSATSNVASEEFVPPSDWSDDPSCHYLLVDLPDFKKEWLKLQVDEQGHVIVSGEGPARNKILHFEKSYDVPQNSDLEKISGNFSGGVLYVIIPKKVTEQAKEQEQEQERGKETTSVAEGIGKPDQHTKEGEKQGKESTSVVEKKRDHTKEEEKNGKKTRKGGEEKPEDTKEQEEISKETAKQVEERREGKKEEEGDGNLFQRNVVEKTRKHEEQDDHNGRRYGQDHRDKSSRIGHGEGNLEDLARMGTWREEGGLLASVTEMLYKNKGIVMAAVLAFSLGVLVSQKFQSNVGVGTHGSLSPM